MIKKLTPEALVRAQAYGRVITLCEMIAENCDKEMDPHVQKIGAALSRSIAETVAVWIAEGQ